MNNKSNSKLLSGFGEMNFSKQYRQGNRVYDSNEVAMCLNAAPVGNMGGYSYLYIVPQRIDKTIRRKDNKSNEHV